MTIKLHFVKTFAAVHAVKHFVQDNFENRNSDCYVTANAIPKRNFVIFRGFHINHNKRHSSKYSSMLLQIVT